MSVSLPIIAEALPATPVITITGALLLEILIWATLFTLIIFYDHTFGAFIRKLADMVEDIWIVGGPLGDALDASDRFVMRQMAAALNGLETAVAATWGSLAWLVRETADALVDFASDVYYAIEGLVEGVIPTQVEQRTRPLAQGLAARTRIEDRRAREEALARTRGIDAVNRDLTVEARARERGIDRIESLLTTLVIPRIRGLEQGLADVIGFTRRNLAIRTRRLEQLLAAGAIGAVAIAALTRVFPYWQCTNVRRLMRGTCRANPAWLGLLFGAGIEALVVTQLCDFINALSVAAKQAQPLLLEFVDAENVLIGCYGMTRPPELPIGPLGIPPASPAFSFSL